jgi:small-conductance mechanosensitive channel|tara:strand:- start:926 stop:1678 length:753 start_codon:yes stop_codon:yes gene_type:complete
MADVFNPETKTETTEVKETEGYLSKIVGEGNKYANVEELAKGAIHGNEYITKLEGEMAELRSELDKRVTAEDMVQQVKRETAEQRALLQQTQENTTPQLDEQQLSALISNTIEQKDSQKLAQQNIQSVDKKMKELYGEEKAAEIVQQKALQLGVSVDKLAEIAATSPEMFFNSIGVSQGSPKVTTPAPTVGSTSTEAVQTMNSGQHVEEGTWDYFEQLRRSNPREYFKPAVQQKLFKMREEKGRDGFYKT